MSGTRNVLSVIFLFCMLYRVVFSVPDTTKDIVFDKDNLDIIDLSYLGKSLYGKPSEATGKKLENWDPKTSHMNPEELGEYAEGDMLVPVTNFKNGLRNEATRWPNAIVPFVIEGTYSNNNLQNIYQAIADYHRYTCVRFVPYNGQTDYVRIANFKTGCWSSVGRIGGMQNLNLQTPGCVNNKGTIIHELMHALGFVHEQSRWERDNFVLINRGNIISAQTHNFKKVSKESTIDFGVQYDFGSIMHYGPYAFSSNNQPTIVAKVASDATIGQRIGFSEGDLMKINTMYKCNPKFLVPLNESSPN